MLEMLLTIKPKTVAAGPGQMAFTTPGTYDFVVPGGVYFLCGVGIGAGGGGWINTFKDTGHWGSSGGGGGLGWKNQIPVTPGEHLTVVVGQVGVTATGAAIGTKGGDTYLARGATRLFAGNGGDAGGDTANDSSRGKGGTYQGDGGGNGGDGVAFDYAAAGGGAAGGYNGKGGNGTDIGTATAPAAGTGAGSGGTGGSGYNDNVNAGRGGGTGLLGLGTTAVATPTRSTNGNPGSQITGSGEFGGGSSSSRAATNTPGLNGGLRLIWGAGRAYPSTNVLDV